MLCSVCGGEEVSLRFGTSVDKGTEVWRELWTENGAHVFQTIPQVAHPHKAPYFSIPSCSEASDITLTLGIAYIPILLVTAKHLSATFSLEGGGSVCCCLQKGFHGAVHAGLKYEVLLSQLLDAKITGESLPQKAVLGAWQPLLPL